MDTPKRGSGNYITDVLGKDRVLAYLPMDGDAMDEVGDFYTEENGKLYFVEGYFGEGVRLDDGYISLTDYEVGKNSFTVSQNLCIRRRKLFQVGKRLLSL